MSLLDDRGQSAPLGMALLLGLMLIGTTAVVAFGSTALSDTQGQSDLAKAEQTMTLFDSQTAQVALGDSSVQTVDFGQAEGGYEVRPNSGKISIIQLDCDDDDVNDDNDDIVDTSQSDEDDAYVLPPTDLGEIVYTNDGKTIAYQGGGVWRKDDGGGSTMISPPEFHYRGATLTLPVILTRGQGAGSGSLSAKVTAGSTGQVFPDATESFPDRSGEICWEDDEEEPFENPINDGQVIVRIESQYADAWGRYFDSRTEGDITYPSDNEVHVELVSLGQVGDFDMPGEASSVPVSGTSEEHGVKEFNITLRPDDKDSADFNNLQWSMYAEEGDQQLEIHLRKSGSNGCPNTDITADLSIYYSDDGGDTYQGWYKADAFEARCKDLNDDPGEEIYLIAHFVDDQNNDGNSVDVDDPGDPSVAYTSLSQSNLEQFKPDGTFETTTTFDGHGDWEPKTYDSGAGDTETVDRIVNHYFAEMPTEFDLTVDDKNSDSINEGASHGTLVTGGSGRYVTYLHVTKNEVEIELD